MAWRDVMKGLVGGVAGIAADAFQKARDELLEDDDDGEGPGGVKSAGADTGAGADSAVATVQAKPLQPAASDPESLFWDPFVVVEALGYKERPTNMTYGALHAIRWRVPTIQTIIKTRVDQVSNFAVPQPDKFQPGYRVLLRDRKQKPSKASEQRSKDIERWVGTTGVTENPAGRDSFETFLKKITLDSLTYDQAPYEIVPANDGTPAEFYAVDGSTIRLADTSKLHYSEDAKEIRYVQIYDANVVAQYTSEQLAFIVRNPTTNIRNLGYGQSEIEMLVHVITALLWSFDYNAKQFTQGTAAKGILNFKGAIPDKQLRAFRKHWYAMVAGVENAFRTPIVNADELQWVDIQKNNKDMEFSAWFDFLIKVSSSMYGMDPMEINFKYGDSGGGKAMFESGNASKLTASKDKGLKPLLRMIQRSISTSLVSRIDEDFVFEFCGLEASTPDEMADLNAKLVKVSKTVNELRAENDDPPLEDGDIILDPVYAQTVSQRKMSEQQAQMSQPGGVPGEGPDGMDFSGLDDDGDTPDGPGGGDSPFGGGAEGGGGGGFKPFQKKGGAGADAAKPAKPDAAEKSMQKAQRRPGIVIDLDL